MSLSPWWYAGFALSVALCATPYACFKWQEWVDRRDAEAWARMPGATQ